MTMTRNEIYWHYESKAYFDEVKAAELDRWIEEQMDRLNEDLYDADGNAEFYTDLKRYAYNCDMAEAEFYKYDLAVMYMDDRKLWDALLRELTDDIMFSIRQRRTITVDLLADRLKDFIYSGYFADYVEFLEE